MEFVVAAAASAASTSAAGVAWLGTIANYSIATLLGGVSGGLVGAFALAATWWWDSRRKSAHDLLREGLEIHASKEAWILEGPKNAKLSESVLLGTNQSADTPWLRLVEVRTVLDQASWNAPAQNFYGFLNDRRAWIVRDQVEEADSEEADSYHRTSDVRDLRSYPALLSSKALHELAGWTERVTSFCIWRIWPFPRARKPIAPFFSDHTLRSMWPLLAPIRNEDRIHALGSRLSEDAKSFLRWYRDRYPRRDPGKH